MNYVKDSRGNRVGSIDGNYIKDKRGSRIGSFDGGMHTAAGAAGLLLLLSARPKDNQAMMVSSVGGESGLPPGAVGSSTRPR